MGKKTVIFHSSSHLAKFLFREEAQKVASKIPKLFLVGSDLANPIVMTSKINSRKLNSYFPKNLDNFPKIAHKILRQCLIGAGIWELSRMNNPPMTSLALTSCNLFQCLVDLLKLARRTSIILHRGYEMASKVLMTLLRESSARSIKCFQKKK